MFPSCTSNKTDTNIIEPVNTNDNDIYELSDGLSPINIDPGVFEAMELKKSKLSKLKAIKEFDLETTYYIEKGTPDTVYYYDQIFGHRPLATEEQKEKLTRLYKILPQVVKLNF